MGWKKVKEHYGIEHIVCVTRERKYGEEPVICVGSPYIHDLIVINMKGELLKRDDGRCNEKLRILQQRLDEDTRNGTLRKLIEEEDTFKDLKTVYWVGDNKHIVQLQCEEYGWPNCTTDGRLMYENTFTKDLDTAKRWLLKGSSISPDFWCCVKERFGRIWDEIKRFKYDIREVWRFVYVRLWGKNHIVEGINEYD